jgi:hypothetical protein
VPNHATRPLGEIERHYCGRCGYLFLSHGAYTLHPCDALGGRHYHEALRLDGTGVTIWQPSGLSIYAAMPAEDYSSGGILGYDDQPIVMTAIRVSQPEFINVTSKLDSPRFRRIERPRTVEADFRSTRPVRLGDVLCQYGNNRLRPGRIGDSPHGVVTKVHHAVTVSNDDVWLRFRWEGTLVFSGPITVRAGDIPFVSSGFEGQSP